MTVFDIKDIVCLWLSSHGYSAVKAPTSKPAAGGTYVSVAVGDIFQDGSAMMPPPGKQDIVFQHIATVNLYEVYGDGEVLRNIKNLLQTDDFDNFANSRFQIDEKDRSLSVWETGDIEETSRKDGDFWITEKALSFQVAFNDFIEIKTTTIKSVEGNVNEEHFKTSL